MLSTKRNGFSPIALSPFSSVFPPSLTPKPKKILFTLSYLTAKVSASVFVQRLNFVTRQIKESEEELESSEEEVDLWDIFSPRRSNHEWNIWTNFAQKVRFGVFFEVCVQSFFMLEQIIASHVCTASTFKKIIKSIPESASRKAATATFRGWSNPYLAYKVFLSALRGQALYWASLFVVSVVFDFTGLRSSDPISIAAATTTTTVVAPKQLSRQRVGTFLGKCCLGCFLSAVGAGLGTLIRPGFGTHLGMFIMAGLVK